MAKTSHNVRVSHVAVEAAIRALAETRLTTKSDAMLRAFLAFRAVHRDGVQSGVDTPAIKAAVSELFMLLPTPEGISETKCNGTIALRGSNGRPRWMRNDAYRGSFLDYVGPNSPGRVLFTEEDWRRPLREDAVDIVAETLNNPRYAWPPRDALAAVALRNTPIDGSPSWDDLMERARRQFGLSPEEWLKVTSPEALEVDPLHGDPWVPEQLSPELRPHGATRPEEHRVEELPSHLGRQVKRVLNGLEKHGSHAIVALSGVPGTSKSYTARIAARAFASKGCLREIQFSPGYTYEEFMEGPRYGQNMEVEILAGAFLDLNGRAIEDPAGQYVLLIEEFTRADLPRVLGELLTYIEYRDEDDLFTTMYRRETTTRIAPNVAILATFNPADRSAVNVDAALIRRMRILDFPPSIGLLREILSDNGVHPLVIEELVGMFNACNDVTGPDRFAEIMPFGHALFAGVEEEEDLYHLWHEELKRMLVRPHAPRHELYDTIVEHYPWHTSPTVSVERPEQVGEAQP